MRYANHECAKCGAILPANELTTVTDDVYAGSTRYQRRSHGTLRPGGRADHYSKRRSRLCPKCLTKRRLGQLALISVAAALFAPAIAIPVIGVGAILFVLFALRRWLGMMLVVALIAAGVVWMIGGHPLGMLQSVGSSAIDLARSTGRAPRLSAPKPSQRDDAEEPSVKAVEPDRSTSATPPKPIVQKLPVNDASYRACSATVTDHCIEG